MFETSKIMKRNKELLYIKNSFKGFLLGQFQNGTSINILNT